MKDLLFNTLAWAAQDAAPAAAGADAAGQPPFNPVILMMVVMGVLAYFMLLRPQKTEARKRQQMLDGMSKGDSVITAGGIHGTIENIDKEKGIVTVCVAPKVCIKFNKGSVTTVAPKSSKKKDEGGEANS